MPKILIRLLMVTALALPFTLQAAGTITLPATVPFASNAHVPAAVRTECGLEQKTAEFIRAALGSSFKVSTSSSVSGKTAGKALDMKITNVLAPGGGPWSGPKSVTVKGTLYDSGKQLGSFTATRNTTRGRGTCDMLHRDAKEIAADIAKWMESPGPDSYLGDAKR